MIIDKRSPYFVKEQFDSMLNDCLLESFNNIGPLNLQIILDNMAVCEKKTTSMKVRNSV